MLGETFSIADDRWPLWATVIWIATRSLKYTEKLAFTDPSESQAVLSEAWQGAGVPLNIGLAAAFHELNHQIDRQTIKGHGAQLKWIVGADFENLPIAECFARAGIREAFEPCRFDPQVLRNATFADDHHITLQDFVLHNGEYFTPRGSGAGHPNPDGSRIRWSWKGVSFARADVLNVWPDLPSFSAWKQAKAQPWKPLHRLSPVWVDSIKAGHYIPISEAVALLAFGPDLLPIGLDPIEEHAARLRAGLALLEAGCNSKLTIYGQATFRLPHFPSGVAPPASFREIEPSNLKDKTLVIDGACDWIGATLYADNFPDCGQATESVGFIGVAVHRDSFRLWLNDLSGQPAPKKRGPQFKFDWTSIEAEALRLMDQHGDFQGGKPLWNAQARLESKLLEFCSKQFRTEPSQTQLRTNIGSWLTHWRNSQK